MLPAGEADPFLAALRSQRVKFHAVPVSGNVRTNLAITESDGTTTRVNGPGAVLSAAEAAELSDAVAERAQFAEWVVMSGSLPPGLPSWYSGAMRRYGCKVAVDTSDGHWRLLAAGLDLAAPDLLKPNSEELTGLSGVTPESLESALAQGDPGPVVTAARRLLDRGVGAVLATLGAAGAVLVDGTGAWLATPPPVQPRNTVGAGDSSLAGYVRADIGGASALPACRWRSPTAAKPLPCPDRHCRLRPN